MKKDDKVIQRPLRGKRIEFAPTTGIDMFPEVVADFMRQIFDFEPGDYLISDEASLFDFTGVDEMELRDIPQKIRAVYDLDVSEIEASNLLEVFVRIHSRKYGGLS